MGCTTCEETVSLGNVARSTTSTRYPFRDRSIAVGEPAQRAPTMIVSYAVFMFATFKRSDTRVSRDQFSDAPLFTPRPDLLVP